MDFLNRKPLLIGVCLLLFLFLILWSKRQVFYENDQVIVGLQESTPQSLPSVENDVEETVMIDLKGEVKRPGVYELPQNARVKDAIEEAGGFTVEADEWSVNLAQKVMDEMVIFVPRKMDGMDAESLSTSMEGKVRINYATQEEIETLNGIGPKKAQAIIQFREENGFFQTIDDLLQVQGIGEKTLEKIKDQIQIP